MSVWSLFQTAPMYVWICFPNTPGVHLDIFSNSPDVCLNFCNQSQCTFGFFFVPNNPSVHLNLFPKQPSCLFEFFFIQSRCTFGCLPKRSRCTFGFWIKRTGLNILDVRLSCSKRTWGTLRLGSATNPLCGPLYNSDYPNQFICLAGRIEQWGTLSCHSTAGFSESSKHTPSPQLSIAVDSLSAAAHPGFPTPPSCTENILSSIRKAPRRFLMIVVGKVEVPPCSLGPWADRHQTLSDRSTPAAVRTANTTMIWYPAIRRFTFTILPYHPQTLEQAKKAFRKSGGVASLYWSETTAIERCTVVRENSDRIKKKEVSWKPIWRRRIKMCREGEGGEARKLFFGVRNKQSWALYPATLLSKHEKLTDSGHNSRLKKVRGKWGAYH